MEQYTKHGSYSTAIGLDAKKLRLGLRDAAVNKVTLDLSCDDVITLTVKYYLTKEEYMLMADVITSFPFGGKEYTH